jgi:hypothetical protein
MVAPPAAQQAASEARSAADEVPRAAGEAIRSFAPRGQDPELEASAELGERSARDLLQGADEATKLSSQNLQAAAAAQGALMEGVQQMSRAWIELANERVRSQVEGIEAFTRCRTPADWLTVQTDLAQGALKWLAVATCKTSEISLQVADDANRAWRQANEQYPPAQA